MRKIIIALLTLILFASVANAIPAYFGGSQGLHLRYVEVDSVRSAAEASTFWQGAIQTIAAAETTDDDQLFAATTGHCNQTTNIAKVTFLAQPDVPRNIIATFNASTSGSIKITGTDISGAAITENLTISSASTGASTMAFKTVTRVDADLTTGQTNKTLKMGTGDLLGLNDRFATNPVLFCALNDTREGTAPAVTVNSTVLSLNTIDTSTAPGGKVLAVWMAV